jgi:hypothetical protein
MNFANLSFVAPPSGFLWEGRLPTAPKEKLTTGGGGMTKIGAMLMAMPDDLHALRTLVDSPVPAGAATHAVSA